MKNLLPFLAFLFSNALYASSPIKVQPVPITDPGRQFTKHKARPYEMGTFGRDWSFVENKGQLAQTSVNESGQALKGDQKECDVKYYSHEGNVHVFCKPGMISFVFIEIENEPNQISEATGTSVGFPHALGVVGAYIPSLSGGGFGETKFNQTPSNITTSRMDLVLIGSNPNAQITASDQQEYYENFYTTGDANHGITEVHTFKTITYKDIYPHIDMILNPAISGMEYSFLVHPGANVKDIKLKWNGANRVMGMKNGGFRYQNTLGSLEESSPKCFISGNTVESGFIKKDGFYCFRIGKYNKHNDLIIDPIISWATYLGGSAEDKALGLCVDKSSNIYLTGQTASSSAIATSGSNLSNYAGGAWDAFLSKFNSTGKPLWSTYFGGSDQDISYCTITDSSGNAYISGTTLSNGISTTGAYQTTNNGNGDAFLAKFNTSGSIIWSTYFGGTNQDYTSAITIDSKQNAIISGVTYSTSPMATSGAYQTSNFGNADAFLAKFSSGGTLQRSTLFGGTGIDRGTGIGVDSLDNIFMTGPTSSTSNIATSGAYQTSYGGGIWDCYIAKFDNKGAIQWSTFYGGSDQDAAITLTMDKSGNPLITGYTWSTSKIATSGTYLSNNAGVGDAFLTKFSNKGSLLWGTYEGGSSADIGYAISVDQSDNIFLTGFTQSTSGFATSGAYQSSFGGGNGDAWISKFNKNGGRLWSTYYGGLGNEQGQNIVAYKGYVYVSGYTASSNSISTSGAYQQSYGGGNNDAFLIKIQDSCFHHKVSIVAGKPICSNANSTYFTNSFSGSQYAWGVTNGNIISSSTDTIVTVKWNKTSKGSIKITQTNILGCIDTISLNVNIDTFGINYKYSNICLNDSTQFSAIGKSFTYLWDFGDGNSSVKANPQHLYSKPLNYIVKLKAIDSIGCKDSMSHTITIVANPLAMVVKNTSICAGDSINIGGTAVSGNSYLWTSNPLGFTSSKSNPYAKPGLNTTYYLTEKNSAGCSKSDSVILTVNPSPMPIVGNAKSICVGDTIKLGSTPINGHSYSWTSSPSGLASTNSQVAFNPNITQTVLLLETINSTGCSKKDSTKITVYPIPNAIVGLPQTICSGDSVSIGSAPVAGNSYFWASKSNITISTNSQTFVKPIDTTIYYLTEKNPGGCRKSDSVKITVNPLPNAYIGNINKMCIGDTVILGSAFIINHSYSWVSSPAGFTSTSSQITINAKTTTSYSLKEVINTTGCSKKDSIKITVNPLPIVNAGSPQTVCAGGNVTLGVFPEAGHSYSWTSFPSGFSSTSSNPSDQPTNSTIYILDEKINTTGCQNKDSVFVLVNPLPQAVTGGSQNICIGDSTVIGFNAVSAHTYSWSSVPAGFGSSLSDPKVSPKNTTSYYLTETINNTGCQKTNSMKVFVFQLPDARFTSDQNYSLRLDLKAIDTTLSSYKWNFGDGQSGSKFKTTHSYKKDSLYDISLKVSDANGCSSSYDSMIEAHYSAVQNPINNNFNLKIFPNPFQSSTNISYNLTKSSKLRIALFDITGKQIALIANENQQPGNYQLDINAEKYHLQPGMYLIRFEIDDGYVSRSIVKF